MNETTQRDPDTSDSETESGECVRNLSYTMQKQHEQHNQRGDCWYPGYDSMQGSDYIDVERDDESAKTDARQQSRQESTGDLNTEGECWSSSYCGQRSCSAPNDISNDVFEPRDHANKIDMPDRLVCDNACVYVNDNRSAESENDDKNQGERLCTVNDGTTNKADDPVCVPLETPNDQENEGVEHGRETNNPVNVIVGTPTDQRTIEMNHGGETHNHVSISMETPFDQETLEMKHGREIPDLFSVPLDNPYDEGIMEMKHRHEISDRVSVPLDNQCDHEVIGMKYETAGENTEDITSGEARNNEDLDEHGEIISSTEYPRHTTMTWLLWLILASMFCVLFLIPTFYRIANGCAIILGYVKLIYPAVPTWPNLAKGMQRLIQFCCLFKILNRTFKSRSFDYFYGHDKTSDFDKTGHNNTTKTLRGSITPNWIFDFRGFETSGNIFAYPLSGPWTTTNGKLVCACTEDQETMENPLRDSSLDYHSIEESDVNLTGNEAPSPFGVLEASNEDPNEEINQTEQNGNTRDSGYAEASQSLSTQRSYSSTHSSSNGNLSRPICFGNVMEDPNLPSTLIAQPDTLREMQMKQGALFLLAIICNVRYGTNDELLANVISQQSGGIIIDRTFAGYIENKTFEENLQYRAIEEQRHSTLCKVLRNGDKFLSKTIPRRILNVDMLRRYLRASQGNTFLPRILGVLFDTNDIKILFQFRSGYTLAEMMRGGRFIQGLDLARFIWYLVDSVQKLHREDIALLSINPFTISLDEEYNLATIQFTNIQLTNTSEQLIVDYPSYAPIGRIDTGNTGDRKSFDMYSLGVLCHCLLNKGEELWHGLNPAEIVEHADDVYKRVVSLDQRQHFVVPYVVHLALCLLHPNANARPTAETVFQHVFFKNEVHALTALRRVNTHGHGYPYWMVTITDGFRLLHVTTTEDGTALYELLSDLRLRDMIGQATAQAWYTGMRQRCAITIHSDLMLEVRIRN